MPMCFTIYIYIYIYIYISYGFCTSFFASERMRSYLQAHMIISSGSHDHIFRLTWSYLQAHKHEIIIFRLTCLPCYCSLCMMLLQLMDMAVAAYEWSCCSLLLMLLQLLVDVVATDEYCCILYLMLLQLMVIAVAAFESEFDMLRASMAAAAILVCANIVRMHMLVCTYAGLCFKCSHIRMACMLVPMFCI